MPDPFLREIVRHKQPLFARIMRFNFPRSTDYAPERLPDEAAGFLASGFLGKLEERRLGARRVRTYLRGQSALASPGQFFHDFREERRRLALLDGKTLERLAVLFGGCVHAPEAAHSVRRSEVLALRGALGAYYEYILLRGRFQLGHARTYFTSRHRELPLVERIPTTGQEALRVCIADWPEALRSLARPLLPGWLSFTWPEGLAHDPAIVEHVWAGIKKLLLREVSATCRQYFT